MKKIVLLASNLNLFIGFLKESKGVVYDIKESVYINTARYHLASSEKSDLIILNVNLNPQNFKDGMDTVTGIDLYKEEFGKLKIPTIFVTYTSGEQYLVEELKKEKPNGLIIGVIYEDNLSQKVDKVLRVR